ncbi:MAG: hypothetical protein QOE08_20 [Thermoleophilaceae bacterium]|nr:hypothetical protein [Thermoleophilaceae bacterium]
MAGAALLAAAPAAHAQAGGATPTPTPTPYTGATPIPATPLPGNLVSRPVPAWSALASRIAQPWLKLQFSNGVFDDYILGPGLRSRYGDAMLGYGLLQTGIRDGNKALIGAGMLGVTSAVNRSAYRKDGDAPFENLAVAEAYNLARKNIPGDPVFKRARKRWERFLSTRAMIYMIDPTLVAPDRDYWNKWLVEAVGALEMLRTGVTSTADGAMLSDRAMLQRAIENVINREIPRLAEARMTDDGHNDRTLVLSDAPTDPLAYQAFSFGLYARAVRLLGSRADGRAMTLLQRVANASWALAAPDGDVAYWGRSQEQAWALSFTAYGAEVAARYAPDKIHKDRYRALARRTVARLYNSHPILRRGLALTPALGLDPLAGKAGLDPYAHMADYNGLALAGLNWAISEVKGDPAKVGTLASDAPSGYRVGFDTAEFASVRTNNLWYVVKRARTNPAIRYDVGLVAMKRRIGRTWRDVMPLRPFGKDADSFGPTITTDAGPVGNMDGDRMSIGANGIVQIDGGFRNWGGRYVRTGLFSYQPTANGVLMRFGALPGERYLITPYFRRTPAVSSQGDATVLDDGDQRVTISPTNTSVPSGTVTLEPGGASGADPSLTRARVSFSVAEPRDVGIEFSLAPVQAKR